MERTSLQLVVNASVTIVLIGVLVVFSLESGDSTRSVELSQLLREPSPQAPIVTENAAERFAVHIPEIQNALEQAQQKANYPTWEVSTTRKLGTTPVWDVSIRSNGLVPSFLCRARFDEAGQIDSSQCEFLK